MKLLYASIGCILVLTYSVFVFIVTAILGLISEH